MDFLHQNTTTLVALDTIGLIAVIGWYNHKVNELNEELAKTNRAMKKLARKVDELSVQLNQREGAGASIDEVVVPKGDREMNESDEEPDKSGSDSDDSDLNQIVAMARKK